ncbi:hypothetical protein M0R45_035452 [Rubus argutus]|uniref:Leucine-rich repeat-containing N-terminal plant-type domain-containing protein n=1 Tax=Rubus argutus TaxID=59490 RepID=A0AAW1VW34_RUBAR
MALKILCLCLILGLGKIAASGMAESTIKLAHSNTLVDESFNVTCIEEEKKALFRFKHGLEDPLSVLDSWVGKDCCKWDGRVL